MKQRFGAIGKKGSIALIERLWRTLKGALGLRLLRPLVAEDLRRKVELGLVHYAHFRPYQALGGAESIRHPSQERSRCVRAASLPARDQNPSPRGARCNSHCVPTGRCNSNCFPTMEEMG